MVGRDLVIVRCDPAHSVARSTLAGAREVLLFKKKAEHSGEEADEESEGEAGEEKEEDPKDPDGVRSAEEGDDRVQHVLRILPGNVYLAAMCSAAHQVSVGHSTGRSKSTRHVCSNTAGASCSCNRFASKSRN